MNEHRVGLQAPTIDQTDFRGLDEALRVPCPSGDGPTGLPCRHGRFMGICVARARSARIAAPLLAEGRDSASLDAAA